MDAESVRDLFAEIGPMRIKRMFGGLGIFIDDMMFALEADGALYIKADAETASLFAAEGSSEFTYSKGDGKVFRMSYWRLPDGALDDPAEAALWARRGVEAARRAAQAKPDKKARRSAAEKSGADETASRDLFGEFQADIEGDQANRR